MSTCLKMNSPTSLTLLYFFILLSLKFLIFKSHYIIFHLRDKIELHYIQFIHLLYTHQRCWNFCRNYQSNVSTKMYSFKFFFGIASLFTFLYMIFIVLNGPPLEQISLMWTVDTSHQLIQEHIANDKNYIDRYLHLIQIDSYFAYLYAPFLAMVIQGKTPYELMMEMRSRKRNNYVLKENNVHVYFNKWYPMVSILILFFLVVNLHN